MAPAISVSADGRKDEYTCVRLSVIFLGRGDEDKHQKVFEESMRCFSTMLASSSTVGDCYTVRFDNHDAFLLIVNYTTVSTFEVVFPARRTENPIIYSTRFQEEFNNVSFSMPPIAAKLYS
jgi:hypothetical protein